MVPGGNARQKEDKVLGFYSRMVTVERTGNPSLWATWYVVHLVIRF